MTEVKKVWVTKYALTKGIIEAEVMPWDPSPGYVWVRWHDNFMGELCLKPSEWRASKPQALARAEEMREAKLNSLQAQIRKLQKLKIKVEPRK